ncbi:ArsR family transcriptional regulator [Butyrivibrio sp. CB08]|uniref:ArsR/SmtB family transcription factor n=1 Tax=Butyrivibrio sp. CB08 TaxID=2364879 RepID=UPI000EA876C9|nr:helix-turn-helix domain-containing protein [Butyrivibrio sp. CB08]RKM62002.1 ArsR family transcriptional regulator [Butyrivibrio sp. CB08]
MKQEVRLNLNNIDRVTSISKALSSKLRVDILRLLDNQALNISSIAEELDIPVSTAALQIKVLEEAGLVVSEPLPGIRGSQKVSGIKVGTVHIDIKSGDDDASSSRTVRISMPIGNYSDCQIEAPCGISSERQAISPDDDKDAFYLPDRTTAQIIWFYKGFLEYRFPKRHVDEHGKIKGVEFTFEACSEAPGYNNTWPSDITIWINGVEIGGFRSEGDYGGRRGKLNPEWWPDILTQYGKLYSVMIDAEGCYVDNKLTSKENVKTLGIDEGDFISFKIGVKESSEFVGGINLFGNRFGDFDQNIEMVLHY